MSRGTDRKLMRLLSLLRAAGPAGYISGQSLAKSGKISRSAIWKQVRTLRQYGYGIESSRGLGYRLVTDTTNPVPWELGKILKTKFIGRDVLYLQVAESTQSVALSIAARNESANGIVVIAESQEAGRGRQKRRWFSPRGGLWFSVLLRPRIPTSSITLIPLVAALAVREAIAETTMLEPRLKWPNDIMISGKKVAGILVDIGAEADLVNYAVIGVGVNANVDAAAISAKVADTQGVTSLQNELGHEVSALDLLRHILENLEHNLDLFAGGGESQILSAWKKHSDMLGRKVAVLQNGKIVHEGVAVDLGRDGSLVLEMDSGKKVTVISGDVRVRY
jgi:BirA family biotin operon repressor/biotin-[acetyl-CoA-carboxylase] ligase